MATTQRDVSFTPESGHQTATVRCRLSAKSGLVRPQQTPCLFDQFIGAGSGIDPNTRACCVFLCPVPDAP
jgi:hypothetical protein